MKAQVISWMALAGLVAACDAPVTRTGEAPTRFIETLPESVVQIAAPYQDLTKVVILPEDGCFWYQHSGPVETTLLPLRSTTGRPICTRPPEPDETAETVAG